MDMAPRRPVNPGPGARAPVPTATTEKDGERAASPFHTPGTAPMRFGRMQGCAFRHGKATRKCNHSATRKEWFRAAEHCIPRSGTLEWPRFVRDRSMARADTIRGLERGLRVLQTLQSSSILSLHEIHQATRISKPSLLRILNTLEHVGFVSRRLADGPYRITT